ncbi:hypothetical protein SLEP1_g5163 [Rubroshorea leprosula]|uniref:Uncharacterized protein n=1 Tax=Rubroshorea leprosula TaxID=152421 RepID=A0AAV5HZ61_9ROSI|nr:hypothetical protein SLEP1_g5163 [Rubroshorea leprosula]
MAALLEPALFFNMTPFLTSRSSQFNEIHLPNLHSKPIVITTCCASTPPFLSSSTLPEDAYPEPLNNSPDRTMDRRKVVRLAWEKLVRWSRSWRSKAKTDILERTNKVSFLFLAY